MFFHKSLAVAFFHQRGQKFQNRTSCNFLRATHFSGMHHFNIGGRVVCVEWEELVFIANAILCFLWSHPPGGILGREKGPWEPSYPLFTSLLLGASGLWRSRKYAGKMQESSDAIPKQIGERCKDSNSQKQLEICLTGRITSTSSLPFSTFNLYPATQIMLPSIEWSSDCDNDILTSMQVKSP